QASRHGEVMTPIELLEGHADILGDRLEPVMVRVRSGESLGLALVLADVEVDVRRLLLGHFVSDELADGLDRHYLYAAAGRDEEALFAELAVDEVLASMAQARRRAQRLGAIAIVPFIGLLIAHTVNNNVPLFFASVAGFIA